jgi:RHS repeat-associated protein
VRGRAHSSYPFLTLKERDVETGLDYFSARYYSSDQGRFTSPDELASLSNPLIHANTQDPQTLNKYQYVNNSPLSATDPDGHCSDNQPCPNTSLQPSGLPETKFQETVGNVVIDVVASAGKTAANIGIGINNVSNYFLNGDNPQNSIQRYESSSKTQYIAMHALEVLTVVAPLLGGFGPATTLTASTRQTTVAADSEHGGACFDFEAWTFLQPSLFRHVAHRGVLAKVRK